MSDGLSGGIIVLIVFGGICCLALFCLPECILMYFCYANNKNEEQQNKNVYIPNSALQNNQPDNYTNNPSNGTFGANANGNPL